MSEEQHSEFLSREKAKFKQLSGTILRTVYRDTEEFRTELGNHIDVLNTLEYNAKIIDEKDVGELLCQCCYLVPQDQLQLLTKVCHLTQNLVSNQQIILEHGLQTVTEYLIKGLQKCPPWAFTDLLRALACVVYENGGRVTSYHNYLLGDAGCLLDLASVHDDDIQKAAVQCVENICMRTPNCIYLEGKYQEECLQLFLRILQGDKPPARDDITQSRLLVCSLRGIQNILLATKASRSDLLGLLLAALKMYTLYGLPGAPTTIPTSLNPTPLSQYDPNPPKAPPAEKPAAAPPAASADKSGGKAQPKKGKKKKGKPAPRKGREGGRGVADDSLAGGMEGLAVSDGSGAVAGGVGSGGQVMDTSALYPQWSRVSSSESDFSDTEGGLSNKLRSFHSRVRQCALGCFYALIKATDKRVMFGYWSAFLPNTPGVGPMQGGFTLFTVIMKDPSPKARTGALAVLTALLDGSKQYLMAAEDSDQYRNAPFTPFSVTLGHIIKEIHRCLMLALVSETSPLATTQIIKCLATLVPNVPYQRLKPGLLSRVVKQIRPFLSHRDPNIRVACLTCMGSIMGVQSPLLEVCHILQPSRPPVRHSESSAGPAAPSAPGESGYHSGLPSAGSSDAGAVDSPSGVRTPSLPSGAQTPTLSDSQVFGQGGDMSWVIKLCVKNISPPLLEVGDRPPSSRSTRLGSDPTQPLPVRLESLQLLAQMAKGYFPVLRKSLFLIRDLIHSCLNDKDPSVQLHGAKLLDEMGSILLAKLQDNEKSANSNDLLVAEVLQFWLPLLSGPLPTALQNVTYHAVRSTVCDCLSNIGPNVFEQLPTDKRIMCITLLLGLTGDEDRHVRAATVRALGVYVLYPCLREDVSFVADAANAIITTLEEQNLNVRVKASWSLGNLSDAVVLNKADNDQGFMDDFSDMLLLKLFDVATKASQDNDKVKSNAVRALGNLLRYLPERSYNSSRFANTIENAIQSLIKNVGSGTMKVRWNACYATGNMFRNGLLPLGEAPWTDRIHTALISVVRDCKNFKVRINAAMALSVPESRACYGDVSLYHGVWDGLVTALRASELITDLAEYRYRDSLAEQVCGALVHVAGLLGEPDVETVSRLVRSHETMLLDYMNKYKLGMVEKTELAGKVDDLKQTEAHLTELRATSGGKQSSADDMELMLRVFSSESAMATNLENADPMRSSSPQTGFLQTYD